jgi:hypothetical protein
MPPRAPRGAASPRRVEYARHADERAACPIQRPLNSVEMQAFLGQFATGAELKGAAVQPLVALSGFTDKLRPFEGEPGDAWWPDADAIRPASKTFTDAEWTADVEAAFQLVRRVHNRRRGERLVEKDRVIVATQTPYLKQKKGHRSTKTPMNTTMPRTARKAAIPNQQMRSTTPVKTTTPKKTMSATLRAAEGRTQRTARRLTAQVGADDNTDDNEGDIDDDDDDDDVSATLRARHRHRHRRGQLQPFALRKMPVDDGRAAIDNNVVVLAMLPSSSSSSSEDDFGDYYSPPTHRQPFPLRVVPPQVATATPDGLVVTREWKGRNHLVNDDVASSSVVRQMPLHTVDGRRRRHYDQRGMQAMLYGSAHLELVKKRTRGNVFHYPGAAEVAKENEAKPIVYKHMRLQRSNVLGTVDDVSAIPEAYPLFAASKTTRVVHDMRREMLTKRARARADIIIDNTRPRRHARWDETLRGVTPPSTTTQPPPPLWRQVARSHTSVPPPLRTVGDIDADIESKFKHIRKFYDARRLKAAAATNAQVVAGNVVRLRQRRRAAEEHAVLKRIHDDERRRHERHDNLMLASLKAPIRHKDVEAPTITPPPNGDDEAGGGNGSGDEGNDDDDDAVDEGDNAAATHEGDDDAGSDKNAGDSNGNAMNVDSSVNDMSNIHGAVELTLAQQMAIKVALGDEGDDEDAIGEIDPTVPLQQQWNWHGDADEAATAATSVIAGGNGSQLGLPSDWRGVADAWVGDLSLEKSGTTQLSAAEEADAADAIGAMFEQDLQLLPRFTGWMQTVAEASKTSWPAWHKIIDTASDMRTLNLDEVLSARTPTEIILVHRPQRRFQRTWLAAPLARFALTGLLSFDATGALDKNDADAIAAAAAPRILSALPARAPRVLRRGSVSSATSSLSLSARTSRRSSLFERSHLMSQSPSPSHLSSPVHSPSHAQTRSRSPSPPPSPLPSLSPSHSPPQSPPPLASGVKSNVRTMSIMLPRQSSVDVEEGSITMMVTTPRPSSTSALSSPTSALSSPTRRKSSVTSTSSLSSPTRGRQSPLHFRFPAGNAALTLGSATLTHHHHYRTESAADNRTRAAEFTAAQSPQNKNNNSPPEELTPERALFAALNESSIELEVEGKLFIDAPHRRAEDKEMRAVLRGQFEAAVAEFCEDEKKRTTAALADQKRQKREARAAARRAKKLNTQTERRARRLNVHMRQTGESVEVAKAKMVDSESSGSDTDIDDDDTDDDGGNDTSNVVAATATATATVVATAAVTVAATAAATNGANSTGAGEPVATTATTTTTTAAATTATITADAALEERLANGRRGIVTEFTRKLEERQSLQAAAWAAADGAARDAAALQALRESQARAQVERASLWPALKKEAEEKRAIREQAAAAAVAAANAQKRRRYIDALANAATDVEMRMSSASVAASMLAAKTTTSPPLTPVSMPPVLSRTFSSSSSSSTATDVPGTLPSARRLWLRFAQQCARQYGVRSHQSVDTDDTDDDDNNDDSNGGGDEPVYAFFEGDARIVVALAMRVLDTVMHEALLACDAAPVPFKVDGVRMSVIKFAVDAAFFHPSICRALLTLEEDCRAIRLERYKVFKALSTVELQQTKRVTELQEQITSTTSAFTATQRRALTHHKLWRKLGPFCESAELRDRAAVALHRTWAEGERSKTMLQRVEDDTRTLRGFGTQLRLSPVMAFNSSRVDVREKMKVLNRAGIYNGVAAVIDAVTAFGDDEQCARILSTDDGEDDYITYVSSLAHASMPVVQKEMKASMYHLAKNRADRADVRSKCMSGNGNGNGGGGKSGGSGGDTVDDDDDGLWTLTDAISDIGLQRLAFEVATVQAALSQASIDAHSVQWEDYPLARVLFAGIHNYWLRSALDYAPASQRLPFMHLSADDKERDVPTAVITLGMLFNKLESSGGASQRGHG